jgi:hypothetical protein
VTIVFGFRIGLFQVLCVIPPLLTQNTVPGCLLSCSQCPVEIHVFVFVYSLILTCWKFVLLLFILLLVVLFPSPLLLDHNIMLVCMALSAAFRLMVITVYLQSPPNNELSLFVLSIFYPGCIYTLVFKYLDVYYYCLPLGSYVVI